MKRRSCSDARVGYRLTGGSSRSFLCLVSSVGCIRLIVPARVLLTVTVPPALPRIGCPLLSLYLRSLQ
jgi:hypothetical protein